MGRKDNSGKSFWLGVLTGCIIAAFVAVIVLCVSTYRRKLQEANEEPQQITVTQTPSSNRNNTGLVKISPGKVPEGSVLQDKDVIGKINVELVED